MPECDAKTTVPIYEDRITGYSKYYCSQSHIDAQARDVNGGTATVPAHPIPVVSFGPGVIEGVETVGQFRVCDFPSPRIDSEFD